MNRKVVVCLILAVLAAAGGLFGQDARGRIAGRVLDPSGAPVPRATVDAIQDATQVKVSATTNDSGSYELLYLAPGMYTLRVSASGFESYKHTGVEVRMTDRLTMDVPLTIGQVNESVVVSGQVSLIDTSSANLGQITNTKSIVDLSLPAGNTQALAQYAPGVVNFALPNHPSLGTGAVEVLSNLAVNGARAYNVEYTIDGTPSMWGYYAAYSPPTDMVTEVKVQTATYDATIGRALGGNVNMVLKTGGNQFHVVGQFFHTNQHLWGLDLFSRQWLYNPSTGPVNDDKRAAGEPAQHSEPRQLHPERPGGSAQALRWPQSHVLDVQPSKASNAPMITLGTPTTVPNRSRTERQFLRPPEGRRQLPDLRSRHHRHSRRRALFAAAFRRQHHSRKPAGQDGPGPAGLLARGRISAGLMDGTQNYTDADLQ